MYSAAVEAHPLATKMATSCVIFGMSDAVAQRGEPGGLDGARVARYMLFGAAVHAPVFTAYFAAQDALVDPLYGGGDGGGGALAPALTKLGIDSLVWTPFAWLPLFFGGMAILEGKAMVDAVGEVKAKGWGVTPTLVANWRLWVPANLVNYAAVPPYLRVLWINAVSLVWTVYLSRVQNAGDAAGDDPTG